MSPGCVNPELEEEKPDAPSMADVLQAYEEPSADLTPQSMAGLLVSVAEYVEVLGAAEGFGFLFDDVLGALDEEGEGDGAESGLVGLREAGLEVREQPASLNGNGFARVTRVCNGWEGGSSPDPNDGAIELIIGFTESQVDPVAWGDFLGCRYRIQDNNLLINGDLRIWLGDSLSFSGLEQVGQSPLLVAIDGLVELEGSVSLSALDFRLIPELGSYEIRLPVEGGHVIFFVEGEATKFRAANGVWTCNLEAATCTNDGDPSDTFSW
ncbi:MAG: hypothetical protein CMH57_07370 [Myxococcales bacterium]|nr:hypothetical protein [Myxococcales bacterium]